MPEDSRTLAGRYRLISPLREGGMGKVWTAEHLSLHSLVAIKLLDDELSSRPDAVARFLREARAAAQIRSPHIVQVFDVGIEDGVPFLAMELLQGESLAERLARVGRLSPADTARFLGQVARGIARAHGIGLVHRDLKPDNIFLERNAEEELAKVLDFGVAKALLPGFDTESGATRTGALIGSPHYMSPEQAEGSNAIDQRTDIWAYGVVAYECLTGLKPFNQATIGSQVLAICAWPMPVPSRVAEVPLGFDQWFARACSRALGGRYGSIQEAAQALGEVCKAAPHSSRPMPIATLPGTNPSEHSELRRIGVDASAPLSSLPPRSRERRVPKRWLAVSALVALLGASLLLWKLSAPASQRSPVREATLDVHGTQATPAPAASAPRAPKEPAAQEAVPLAPAPIKTPAAASQPAEPPRKPKARLVPRRPQRGVFDMKEEPY